MAQIQKQYINHQGIDLKNSDLVRQDQFASDMMNAQYDKDGALEKRRGYQAVAASEGGHGLFTYNRLNPSTNIYEEYLLSVSDTLHKIEETTFEVAFSGTATVCTFSLFFDCDDGVYRAQILRDTTLILDEDLGVGFDEVGFSTLGDLKAAIDALADFSATITGESTIPASFLTIIREHDLIGEDATLIARRWVDANSSVGATTPFAGSEANKNEDDFENVSTSQVNNVVYMANGYDFLQKYDGQTVFRAGMPKPLAPTVTPVAGAGINGDSYVAITYEQRDAAGNIVEGDISESFYIAPGAYSQLNIMFENIFSSNEDFFGNTMAGFNDHGAIAVGAQIGVNTITVDDGSGGQHTFQVGDTAFFLNASSAETEREITAISATTITIAGAPVDIDDNAVISNNLRVNIYRTVTGGLQFFLDKTIANNPFTANRTFVTTKIDTALEEGLEFVDPSPQNHGLPPKGKYVATWNNLLTIAGNSENPNTWYFSSIDHPEYFPSGNALLVQANINDRITGLSQDSEVFAIFKQRSIHIVSGDPTFLNIRVDTLTKDLGCVAHATIQEVRGALYFLSDRGVYSIVSGQQPIERSIAIEPIFRQLDLKPEDRFTFKRAVAINHRQDQQYMLFLPVESEADGEKQATSETVLFVEDYFREAYLKWNNLNMMAGVAIYQDALFFSERRFSSFTSNVDHVLYKQMTTGDSFDYNDNTNPVSWNYKTNWYSMGESSIYKKYLRAKLFIKDKTDNNNFTVRLYTEINYVPGLIKTDHEFMDSGTGGYGISPYGTTGYGDVQEATLRVKLRSGKAKAMRFVFENLECQQNVTLNGWELEVATPYAETIKE